MKRAVTLTPERPYNTSATIPIFFCFTQHQGFDEQQRGLWHLKDARTVVEAFVL